MEEIAKCWSTSVIPTHVSTDIAFLKTTRLGVFVTKVTWDTFASRKLMNVTAIRVKMEDFVRISPMDIDANVAKEHGANIAKSTKTNVCPILVSMANVST